MHAASQAQDLLLLFLEKVKINVPVCQFQNLRLGHGIPLQVCFERSDGFLETVKEIPAAVNVQGPFCPRDADVNFSLFLFSSEIRVAPHDANMVKFFSLCLVQCGDRDDIPLFLKEILRF